MLRGVLGTAVMGGAVVATGALAGPSSAPVPPYPSESPNAAMATSPPPTSAAPRTLRLETAALSSGSGLSQSGVPASDAGTGDCCREDWGWDWDWEGCDWEGCDWEDG